MSQWWFYGLFGKGMRHSQLVYEYIYTVVIYLLDSHALSNPYLAYKIISFRDNVLTNEAQPVS